MKSAGRPYLDPRPGQPCGLSLRITANTKQVLVDRARADGRSLSAEAEMMIEFGIMFATLMRAARKTQDIERALLELAQKRFCHTSAETESATRDSADLNGQDQAIKRVENGRK